MVATLGLPSAGLGAQSTPVTVHEAVERALARHPLIQSVQARHDGAQAGVAEARGSRWPQLRADFSALRFEEPMVVAPLHGFNPQDPPRFDRTLLQAQLSLGYTLFDGGFRRAGIRGAEAGLASGSAALRAVEADVVNQVVQAWLAVAAGREALLAESGRLAALTGELDRVTQLLAVGRAPEVERMRVSAALARAEADRISRTEAVAAAIAELARLTGVPVAVLESTPMAPLRATADLPDGELLHARVRESNPELGQARARRAAAEAGVAVTASSRWPEVRLVGGYSDFSSGAGREAGEWQAGVRAGYPIFVGGSRRAAADRSRASLEAADAEVEALAWELDRAVDQAAALARSSAARTAALTVAVTQAEAVVRIERLALDAGAGTQTEWLAATATLLTTRTALIESRQAEVGARITLARLTGTLSATTLRTLLEDGP